ncbi:MAG: UDP-N-acetylmuramoyl-L-alanine--D-glutamate ligase [Alphaproteobacteria bacterium]|nr:UDP-N-acetylmuramoyl-L-alanine--D-glutamate ligase [Alphaproteobacteria bacterium]
MIEISEFKGKKVAVLGLGRSGLSAVRALAAGGAELCAWDDNAGRRDAAEADGIPIADFYAMDWTGIAALVVSPGIPATGLDPHQIVRQARAFQCEVLGDVELFARRDLASKVVAITGTNGKSTTTALAGHVLRACGRRAVEGGNLGTAVLDLPELGEDGSYVLELSSFQIEQTKSLAADVAVLLNLSPDHLDRHGDMAGYVAAKKRLFAGQTPEQLAVVGVDDGDSRAVFDELVAQDGRRVMAVSGNGPVDDGVFVVGGFLYDATAPDAGVAVADLNRGRLVGPHNWQNAAAAFAIATELGCDPEPVAEALMTFPGLPHRLELVGEADGVRFFNDSKATNMDAAGRALGSFSNIYWIAGGRPKDQGLETLAPLFGNVRHAYLIGEATESFAATLGGGVPFSRSTGLAAAVADAHARAVSDGEEGAVVLLSPACASFDQFTDFQARGDAFRMAASDIIGGGQS